MFIIEISVFIRDVLVQVCPLSTPSMGFTVSGVPPFIPNNLLKNELHRFVKFGRAFKTVRMGSRDPKMKCAVCERKGLYVLRLFNSDSRGVF